MKKNKKKKSWKDYLLNLFILALFLTGAFLIARPHIYDYLNGQKSQETLKLVADEDNIAEKRAKLSANKDLYSGADVKEITKEAYQNADAEKIIFDYGIGKIVFLEQDIAVPVVEGVSNDALLVGAGTLKPNQEVGKGNFSLAAHRLATRNSILFSHLSEAEKGQHIKVTIGKESATYVVTEKKVIAPTEVEYIEDSQGEGLLSLICCTDDSLNRWLVRGKLAE